MIKFLKPIDGIIVRWRGFHLTQRKVEIEELPEEVMRKYFGGLGIGAKILYEETEPETDPLSPANLLIAMAGPFTGTGVPTSGRHHIGTRFPYTVDFLVNPMSEVLGPSTLKWLGSMESLFKEGQKTLSTFGFMMATLRSGMPNPFGVTTLMNRLNG